MLNSSTPSSVRSSNYGTPTFQIPGGSGEVGTRGAFRTRGSSSSAPTCAGNELAEKPRRHEAGSERDHLNDFVAS